MSIPDRLNAYIQAIEAFADSEMSAYVGKLKNLPVGSVKGKEFNDPVWGTLSLHPHEVIILDSPLMQRLQRIRQLGVAHFVYPSARHSRLEHSLGVLHQVDQLVESINRNGQTLTEPRELIDKNLRLLLRATGLCHDIGHGVMSHVIENALFNDEDVEQLRREFRDYLDRDSLLQLSEMAAHYILASGAFGELVAEALRVAGQPENAINPREMAAAVVGERMQDRYPQLHELISGPFDADKMDYMARDAKMCGVPVVTDFTRLIQKVRAVEVNNSHLPAELARVVKDDENAQHLVLGVARSGAATLDEVAFGRSLMFDKIYRHHKVRAAEAMVAGICSRALHYLSSDPALIPFKLNDEQLIDITVQWLEASAVRDDGSRAAGFATAADIAQRLRDRDLFVRAFAFATVMPEDGYRGADEQRVAYDDLVRASGDTELRPQLIQAIADTVREIASLVGREDVLTGYPDLEAYISVDPPANKTIDQKPDPSRAYLLDPDGAVVPVDRAQADTRAWADAYVNVRDLGYVFAPRELADFVHVATESVFRTLFGLRVPRGMHAYSRVNPTAADTLKRDLLEAGFYVDKPRDIEPVPIRLTRSDVKKRLVGIKERLSGYSGPLPVDQENGKVQESKLTDDRLRDWLAQFPNDLIDCALIMLENMQFLGREEVNRALAHFRTEHPEVEDAVLSLLGEPKDGASVLTYFALDAGWTAMNLDAALLSGKPIVFVDDLLGTGRSSVNILCGWLGVDPPDPLDEGRGELSARERELLQNTSLHFVFLAELDEGREYLATNLQALGLTGTVDVLSKAATVESIDAVAARHPNYPWKEFKEFCSRVGVEVLLDDREKPQEWREQRALGYGNHGLLVVSAFNTPTATTTALWKNGSFEGREWVPVFPRRTKI